MVLNSVSLLTTDSMIRIFFKIKSIQKPKVENMIRFKTLNITFSLGMLVLGLSRLVYFQIQSQDSSTYIGHYTTSLVLNTTLFLFICMNQDIIKGNMHQSEDVG